MQTAHAKAQPVRRWIGRRVLALFFLGALVALPSAFYEAWRPEYKPLFRGIAPRDAALLAAELRREQISFRIEPGTGVLMVPERDHRCVVLQLTGGSMQLNDVVGLELSDNDMRLTEFAQRVSYQRALQGELSRTIMNLDEVVLARVHVALPEFAPFRGQQAAPKASVAVFARDGMSLPPLVVGGIQRLVAATMPGMEPTEVAVMDHRGNALSARDQSAATPHQFQTATEGQLLRKLEPHVRGLLGAALVELMVRVELTVDFPEPFGGAESAAVDILNVGEEAAEGYPDPPPPTAPPPVLRYSIERIAVTILLDRELAGDALAQVRTLVHAAAALNDARGDEVHVSVRPPPLPGLEAASKRLPISLFRWALAGAFFVFVCVIVLAAGYSRRRARTQLPSREQILRDLRLRLLKVGMT